MATVKELIKLAESRLDDASKDVNVAKVLFYHLADKQPHELYLMYDEEVSSELEAKFLAGMEEYYQGKPIQYIKGVENFFGRDFKVNEDVLIPRYETEELVENILYRIDDYFAEYQSITLCDVGTGSGAIATSLALEEPRLKVFATDISLKAVTVAKDNAKNLGANISNPPYIPQEQEIEAMVKDNEPHVALFGGNDGLYFYRKIFQGVEPLLQERALLAFEMGFDQRELMEAALQEYFPNDPHEIIKDINGKDRMLFIYRNLK